MPLLRLTLSTPHGVPIPGAQVALAGKVRYLAREVTPGTYELPLEDGDHLLFAARFGGAKTDPTSSAGSGRASVEAFDHRTLRTTLFYRTATPARPTTLRALQPAAGEITRITSIVQEGEDFRAAAVLDYLWFTPIGTAPTLGNRVRVLIDGEEAWSSIAEAIDQAQERVHVTTWIYQPTAELRRPKPLSDPGVREPYTAQDVLEATAARGVVVRMLLWDAPFIDIPRVARRAMRTPNDNLEVMQEANHTQGRLLNPDEYPQLSKLIGEHPLYSFHQKTLVVDGKIGFCGGMNLKENDWDTRGHHLFDPRRARFERPRSFRRRIQSALTESDHPPRHDFMAKVEGPAVTDLDANFRERWERLRSEGAEGAENASEATMSARPAPVGSHRVQVIRTMPAPFEERGILDVYLRAIRTARKLVYIEDQYFRSTHVSDALADAVRHWPDLAVIVVTLRSYANDLAQGGWCWEGFRRIQERRRDFELYTLEVGNPGHGGAVHTREVDIHAKLMIVDDLFLTVGSCNINDRGFELEGEINLAVADEELARHTRLRLWREHLGEDPRLTGDLANDLVVWRDHAEANRELGGEVLRRSNVIPFVPKERAAVFDRNVW